MYKEWIGILAGILSIPLEFLDSGQNQWESEKYWCECCTASYLVKVYTSLEGVDSSSSGIVGEEQEREGEAYMLKLKWI